MGAMTRTGRCSWWRAALGTALVAAAVSLAGCTGDSAVGDFERVFAGDPAVESLDLTSHDNQPFTGGVSGDVQARAELSDTDVLGLADRLGAYTNENEERMRGRITLVADGFSCEISGERRLDDDCLSVLLALRADDRAVSGRIGPSTVDVTVDRFESGLSLAGELPGTLEDAAPGRAWTTSVHTQDTADLSLELNDLDARRTAEVLASWEALSSEVPLTGVEFGTDDGITFALARESDLATATLLADRALAGSDVATRFSSDLVRLGESDGHLARQLLTQLDGNSIERLDYIWESRSRLAVNARKATDIAELIAPILASAPAEATSVTIAATDTEETGVELTPGAVPSPAWLRTLDSLLRDEEVRSLRVSADTVDLGVSAVEDGDLARFAPELKTLAPDGARVCLDRGDDAVCVTAGDVIDDSALNPYSREHAREFIRAWNSS